MAGSNLHLARFQEGANIITLSKGQDEAAEGLDYSRFMHSQLPDFLKLKLGKDQGGLISFPEMHSRMRALPSTPDTGVGFGGATRVVLDEFEYHDYAERNYGELKPMIDRGGQLVILSTADQWKANTKFKELYNAAKVGDNNFFPIFLPYDLMPYRTQEWYGNLAKDHPRWQIECHYPKTEEEALGTLKTRAFFSNLDSVFDYKEPIQHELPDKYVDIVKIYQLPVVGRKYCQFTDPSDGKDDPHAIIVMDAVTGEEVAESHGKTPADLCAQIHDDLVRLYNDALNSYELNARAGGLFSAKLKDLDTPNQSPFLKTNGELDRTKTGWWTSKTLKDTMTWGLEEAVRLGGIRIHSKECYEEFGKIIVPEGEKPQATQGAHDDYFDAWMGVWKLKGYVSTGKIKVSISQYGRPKQSPIHFG